MKYKSFMTPGLTKVDGQLYIVPGFYKVSNNTTIDDVLNNWERDETSEIVPKGTIIKVKSKDNIYEVKYNGSFWLCTCKGYQWRKRCKHINIAKTYI